MKKLMETFTYSHQNSERRRVALLIPGGPGQPAATMKLDSECLPRDFSALMIDPPGTGGTPIDRASYDYTPERCANFLASACAEIGVTPDIVLGSSYGGLVAAEMAKAKPELARAIVLVSTMYQGGSVDLSEAREEAIERMLARHADASWYPDARFVFDNWESLILHSKDEVDVLSARLLPLYLSAPDDPAVRDRLKRLIEYSRQDLEAMKAWESGLYQAVDLRSTLESVAVPVLAVAGADDWLAGAYSAQSLSMDFPAVSVKVIERCGHFPAVESPDEYRTILRDWTALAAS